MFRYNVIITFPNYSRGGLIRMKLRKVDPFRPVQLARKAQEMFVAANKAIQQ